MEMMSQDISKLSEALSKLQGSVGSVVKNKSVKVRTKSGDSYSYSYADLTGIWETIRKPLTETGLAIAQTFSENTHGPQIVTVLMHSSGQWLKSILPLNYAGLKVQELGSEITYMRRYALSSILGITTDEEDDDGQAANHVPLQKTSNVTTNTISLAEANELYQILNDCNPVYKTNFWRFLKNEKGIEKLEQLPSDLYKSLKSKTLKHLQESEVANESVFA